MPLHGVDVPQTTSAADGSVLYAFVCKDVSKAPWAVGKRFSDLERCHQSFSKTFPPCKKLKFPKKTLGKASAKTIEKRRQELCAWAAALVQISAADPSAAAAFEQFLAPDGSIDAATCAQLGVAPPAAPAGGSAAAGATPTAAADIGATTAAAEPSKAALAQLQAQQQADAARAAAEAAAQAEVEAAVAAAALAQAQAAAQAKAAAVPPVATPADSTEASAKVAHIQARARAAAEERIKQQRPLVADSMAATEPPTDSAPTDKEMSRKEKIKALAREKAQARIATLRASRGSNGGESPAAEQLPPEPKMASVVVAAAKAGVPEGLPPPSTKAAASGGAGSTDLAESPVVVSHKDNEDSPVLVKRGDSDSKQPVMTQSSDWELVSMGSESAQTHSSVGSASNEDSEEGVPPSLNAAVPTGDTATTATAATIAVEPATSTAVATSAPAKKPPASSAGSTGSAAPLRFNHGMSWLEVWAKASQITPNFSANGHTVRAVPATGSTPFMGYKTRVSGQNYTVVTGGLTTRVH